MAKTKHTDTISLSEADYHDRLLGAFKLPGLKLRYDSDDSRSIELEVVQTGKKLNLYARGLNPAMPASAVNVFEGNDQYDFLLDRSLAELKRIVAAVEFAHSEGE